MAAAFRIPAPEVTYTEHKRHVAAHEFRALEFPVTIVVDTLAWSATMRASGNTVRRIAVQDESM